MCFTLQICFTFRPSRISGCYQPFFREVVSVHSCKAADCCSLSRYCDVLSPHYTAPGARENGVVLLSLQAAQKDLRQTTWSTINSTWTTAGHMNWTRAASSFGTVEVSKVTCRLHETPTDLTCCSNCVRCALRELQCLLQRHSDTRYSSTLLPLVWHSVQIFISATSDMYFPAIISCGCTIHMTSCPPAISRTS